MDARRSASPFAFFGLLFALAVPVWLASPFLGLIPALRVPVSDLVLAFTPLIAAVILRLRDGGASGVRALLAGVFDVRRVADRRWLLVAGLLPLALYLAADLAVAAAGRAAPITPRLGPLLLMAPIVFLLAVGEEVGWTGYALDPLQARFGALAASLLIAIPWWFGHLPSILEIGGTAADMAWWSLGAIGLRILMTWLYNSAGRSLFAVVLFHTALNVWRLAAYPVEGTHYPTRYQGAGYVAALVLASVVVWACGPRTLSRAPRARGR